MKSLCAQCHSQNVEARIHNLFIFKNCQICRAAQMQNNYLKTKNQKLFPNIRSIKIHKSRELLFSLGLRESRIINVWTTIHLLLAAKYSTLLHKRMGYIHYPVLASLHPTNGDSHPLVSNRNPYNCQLIWLKDYTDFQMVNHLYFEHVIFVYKQRLFMSDFLFANFDHSSRILWIYLPHGCICTGINLQCCRWVGGFVGCYSFAE